MDNHPFAKEKQSLNDAISPRSLHLSHRVRELAGSLRDKTAATPYAPDTLILADEVDKLCDYLEQLHGSVEMLLTKLEAGGHSHSSSTVEPTAEDEKAIEIQREIHELHPTVKDTIKALFMWRDSPEERLRDDK